MPKFHDPACIKFINGKFILATNDAANPISLVRQKAKSNETDVVVTLTTGEMYDDTIESITRLVEVTSNKGWMVTIEMSVTAIVYTDAVDREVSITRLHKILHTLHGYKHTPNSEYYLPVSRMIPDRIVPISVLHDMTFTERYGRVRGVGTISFDFVVISPQQCIDELVEALAENVSDGVRSATQFNIGGIEVGDRNVTNTIIDECDLGYVLDLVLTTEVDHAMSVSADGKSCELEQNEIMQFAEVLVDVSLKE